MSIMSAKSRENAFFAVNELDFMVFVPFFVCFALLIISEKHRGVKKNCICSAIEIYMRMCYTVEERK